MHVFDRIRERFLMGVAREDQVREMYDRLYDQVASMMQIQSAISGGPVLKPMRHWALSPDAMAIILADLQERANPHIVEFGCGQSTIVFASWARARGGRITSYEHDASYADAVRRQLQACGLSSQVDLRVVPLVDYVGMDGLPASKSYALPSDRDGIDIALVDGPPYWAGEAGRYHPLKWATDRLNPDGAAYLDDAARQPEQRIVAALRRSMFGVEAAELRAEKGLVKLTRAADGAEQRRAADGAEQRRAADGAERAAMSA
jgi:predicted O-methyltransferase YrrM